MATRITFMCSDCGEDFTELVQTFIGIPQDEVIAPALCNECSHSTEREIDDDDDRVNVRIRAHIPTGAHLMPMQQHGS